MSITAPELTLEQKAYRMRISYRFFDTHVEYTILDSRGDKASFSVKYEDLPGRFDYRTFEVRRPVIAVQLCVLMVLTLVMMMIYPQDSLQIFGFMILYGAGVISFSQWLRRRFLRRTYSSLPSRNGKILVLRDKRHDEIISELESRRMKALRKFAMIDALNAPQAEFRRLRRLKEEGVITALEFDSYRRALGAPESAVPPEPGPDGKSLALAQNALRYHSEFSFHDAYLRYQLKDGGTNAFNIRYRDLPQPTEYRTFVRRDGLSALVVCLGALLGLALVNIVANNHYFATDAGRLQTIAGSLLYVAGFVVLVSGARRHGRREFTILNAPKGPIRVLKDAQHDRIIGEIQNRRVAALRVQAFIDRANSPQSEMKKFLWLKEQGAISDEEFENFRQKLVEEAGEPASNPPLKPPSETLH